MSESSPATSRVIRYTRYGGPEVLEVVDRADPRPGPGQVRLAVRAAGVNPFDRKLREGLLAHSDTPDAPVVPGTDVAGVVEAVGDGVTARAVGDEVLGRASGGAYAARTLAGVDALVAKPPSLSWEVAGSLEVIVHTAWTVLDELDLADGATLLVHGASGGIGTILVQLAVARGVAVVGTAGEGRLADVGALGATAVSHGAGLIHRVREATGAETLDAVADLAGAGPLEDLVALAGDPARVVTIAHPDAGAHGVRFVGRRWVPGVLAEVADLLAAGRLRAPEVTVYPLEEAGRAQEDNRTRKVAGKAVLVP